LEGRRRCGAEGRRGGGDLMRSAIDGRQGRKCRRRIDGQHSGAAAIAASMDGGRRRGEEYILVRWVGGGAGRRGDEAAAAAVALSGGAGMVGELGGRRASMAAIMGNWDRGFASMGNKEESVRLLGSLDPSACTVQINQRKNRL
jgi:hypothetical protein